MEVILLESIKSLGKEGEVIKVADGYARNFLLPQGKALEATSGNIAFWEKRKAQLQAKAAGQKADLSALAMKIESEVFLIKHKVGANDKLYGSVTPTDITNSMALKGYDIDRKKIQLEEQIRTVGEFSVPVRLGPEVIAKIKVVIAKDE